MKRKQIIYLGLVVQFNLEYSNLQMDATLFFAPWRELIRNRFPTCFNKSEAISRQGAKARRRSREEDGCIPLSSAIV
jgi:hypothetical protein